MKTVALIEDDADLFALLPYPSRLQS